MAPRGRRRSTTIAKFKDEQQAVIDAQVDMRGRCVAFVEAMAGLMETDCDTKRFAPLFNKLAGQLAEIETR